MDESRFTSFIAELDPFDPREWLMAKTPDFTRVSFMFDRKNVGFLKSMLII